MEPITIVFLVLGYVISRNIFYPVWKRALFPTSPASALEPAKKEDEYECPVFFERLMDAKMVEAELMKIEEMAVCDNQSCPACLPSRPKIVLKDYKAAEGTNWKNVAQKNKSLEMANKYLKKRGVQLETRPPEVPDYASRTTVYDPSYMREFICWKWVDSDGKVRGLRQMVSPELDVQIYSDQSDKPVKIVWGGTTSTGPR